MSIYSSASAHMSDCGKYRHWLKRNWGVYNDRMCNFIMLNPSTADEKEDKVEEKAGYYG